MFYACKYDNRSLSQQNSLSCSRHIVPRKCLMQQVSGIDCNLPDITVWKEMCIRDRNKLENQKIQPEAEVYDVCRQLCDCILQYESAWEKKEIEMEVEMEDRAEIYADQDLMELVWNNLLSNACLLYTSVFPDISMRVEKRWR